MVINFKLKLMNNNINLNIFKNLLFKKIKK